MEVVQHGYQAGDVREGDLLCAAVQDLANMTSVLQSREAPVAAVSNSHLFMRTRKIGVHGPILSMKSTRRSQVRVSNLKVLIRASGRYAQFCNR